ncbi:hypothetical protein AAF712_010237 [Marasmius tenuissimus]|uniref:Uncharacterized protein n=1 Tax=Marasmius tenuissimus TaxID=585030 RepID=A0ABR2ZMM5_9AGAR
MIQYDLRVPDVSRWPGFSQVSLGSNDPSIWSFTFPPSDVASDAGSDIATLIDPSLWRATKNTLKGGIKIPDIPPILLETFDSRSTSIHWTPSSQAAYKMHFSRAKCLPEVEEPSGPQTDPICRFQKPTHPRD